MKPESSLDLAILTVSIVTLLVGVSVSFAGYLQVQIQFLISWLLCMGFAMLFILGLIKILKKI